jgi:hypothetical protein
VFVFQRTATAPRWRPGSGGGRRLKPASTKPQEGDGSLVGISCLADGADQLFARAVVDMGGALEVVIPAERYRDGLPEEALEAYDDLLSRASDVRRLDHVESNSTAHTDASIQMIQRADRLFAVWDGKPARGYGGTAGVVTYARERDIPLVVIWPDGEKRDQQSRE